MSWFIKDKVIVLISPEPWGENFVSKHHYANYLAKNNKVYFLNPADGFSKIPFSGMDIRTKKIHENLIVVSYKNLIPRLNSLPKFIQKSTYRQQIQRLKNRLNLSKIDLIWSFDPNRFFELNQWDAEKTIYHTVDFHPKAKYEKDIVLSSNYFFGVADLILEEHQAYRKGIMIPHASDLDGFNTKIDLQLSGKNKIRAIYTGNFHQDINYEVLKSLAKENTDVDFMLIGPTAPSNLSSKNTIEKEDFTTLKKVENVFFLGNIPPSHLMSYLELADINLVLFKKSQEKKHCSPHKLMAYFYSGNPTLSNYIDAHKNSDANLLIMAKNDGEILEKFQQIKTNLSTFKSLELIQERRNYAIENSYQTRINEIEKILNA
jgi:hypothetical protein